MAKIDQKLRFSIKTKFLTGRPRFKPPARPPAAYPRPDRDLITDHGQKIWHLRKILRPSAGKNISFLIPSIYIKIRNGQTLEKR